MKIIDLKNRYIDSRGIIINITPETPIGDILYISGKKGAIRGNHYHKTDTHHCFCISGSIKYSEQNLETHEIVEMTLYPGDMALTESGVLHKFEFLEDGAFIAIAKNPRQQAQYEEDTVREEFHDHEH